MNGAWAIGVVLIGVVGGCQEGSKGGEVARGVIGPAGGTITSADDVLTLAIPPGALDEEVELFIERTGEPPAVFGQAYIVQPNPVLRYDLSVSYRQELPDDVSGVAVGAVDAIAYEEGRGQWEPLTILRVDRQAKLVSGLDDGVSIFYALLDDSPGEPSTEGDDTSPMATTHEAETAGETGADDTTGSPDDTTGPGDESEGESTGGSTGEPPPSFGNDVQPILDANCGAEP